VGGHGKGGTAEFAGEWKKAGRGGKGGSHGGDRLEALLATKNGIGGGGGIWRKKLQVRKDLIAGPQRVRAGREYKSGKEVIPGFPGGSLGGGGGDGCRRDRGFLD